MANVTDGSEPDIQRIPAADPPSTSPASSPPTPSAAAAAPLHSVRHEKLLQEWGTERKEEREIKELYRARCTSNKTEMYQLMGFFSVFQGVVFSTVATSTKLTCQTSLLPALLSFLVFIGTAISVHNKFNDYELDTQKLINSENTEEELKNKITLLTRNGDEFSYETYEVALDKKRPYPKLGKSYAAIMSFLVLFTFIILACCILIRCWDQETGNMMLCAFIVCWEKHVPVSIHKMG